MEENVIRIEKEEIPGIKFMEVPDKKDKEGSSQLTRLLESGSRLGNEFKGKVTIQFMTNHGLREVSTTIWNVTAEMVGLKNGINIPISSIASVSM
jgi:hypothetical protein